MNKYREAPWTSMVQLVILANLHDGKDTHLRGLRLFGPKDSGSRGKVSKLVSNHAQVSEETRRGDASDVQSLVVPEHLMEMAHLLDMPLTMGAAPFSSSLSHQAHIR
jgi:hypothetical protein